MKKLKLIDFYIIILIIAAISVVALRTYALMFDFNRLTMQFINSTAATVASWIAVLSTLAFGASLFVKGEKVDLLEKNDNAASFIPSGIVSTALMFMGVKLIKSIDTHYVSLLRPISLIAALLAFLSVGAFFLTILIEQRSHTVKAVFSLCVVLFLSLYACYLYFNKSVHPTNSPNKVIDQLAYLFSAAFFLYESRIAIGRAKWRGYVSFGLIAALLCYYSSIPSLIIYAMDDYCISDSLVESALTLSLAIFITSKVVQTKHLTPDAECDTARLISTLADMREEEIDEMRKASHARAINNMEENDSKSDDASNYTFDIPYVDTRSEFSSDDTQMQ